MMSDDLIDVRAALISRRKTLGLRQADIAEAIGVGQQHVSTIERGTADAALSTLQRYARAVGARLIVAVVDDPRSD